MPNINAVILIGVSVINDRRISTPVITNFVEPIKNFSSRIGNVCLNPRFSL